MTQSTQETATETTERSVPSPTLDEGDHERFSHIVLGGSEAIMRAMLNGEPCTALCGKVWVPSRDPKKFPLCPTCDEVRKTMGWKEPAE